MPEKLCSSSFSETHHAVLFALIAKEVVQRFGTEKGETCIRKAIRRYGEQRGKRMAMRVKADGLELTMTNYLIYSEWQPSGLTHTQSVMWETAPDLRVKVTTCPWNTAWLEYDLLQYGRLYCQEIDFALVKGFNPDLAIEVKKTLSNEGEPCEFTYIHAGLINQDTILFVNKMRSESQGKHSMPWDYHCGHLYKTFSQVLYEDFGESQQRASGAAIKQFAAYFGQEAVQVVLDYLTTDFNKLPEVI